MSQEKLQSRLSSNVHLLPCTVHYNGAAPIAEYFQPSPASGTSSEQTAAFRGRELKGVNIPLPEGAVGAIVAPSQGSFAEINSTFTSLTVWEHDVSPNTNIITDSLSWLKIAKQVTAVVLLFSKVNCF